MLDTSFDRVRCGDDCFSAGFWRVVNSGGGVLNKCRRYLYSKKFLLAQNFEIAQPLSK